MPTSLACVDASVIVRLVTQPDNRVLQDRWEAWQRDGTQLAAPSLLFYEVSNALYRYQQSESMSRERVQAAMDAALALPVEIHPATAALHRAAARVAAQFGLPAAYDAHYLALAQTFDVSFWTADGRLVSKVQESLPWVHLLA